MKYTHGRSFHMQLSRPKFSPRAVQNRAKIQWLAPHQPIPLWWLSNTDMSHDLGSYNAPRNVQDISRNDRFIILQGFDSIIVITEMWIISAPFPLICKSGNHAWVRMLIMCRKYRARNILHMVHQSLKSGTRLRWKRSFIICDNCSLAMTCGIREQDISESCFSWKIWEDAWMVTDTGQCGWLIDQWCNLRIWMIPYWFLPLLFR